MASARVSAILESGNWTCLTVCKGSNILFASALKVYFASQVTFLIIILGKCLQFEGDVTNARIAYEQRVDQSQRPKMVHFPRAMSVDQKRA
jgi:hypothetical protein